MKNRSVGTQSLLWFSLVIDWLLSDQKVIDARCLSDNQNTAYRRLECGVWKIWIVESVECGKYGALKKTKRVW